jgi:hypothetical protein
MNVQTPIAAFARQASGAAKASESGTELAVGSKIMIVSAEII